LAEKEAQQGKVVREEKDFAPKGGGPAKKVRKGEEGRGRKDLVIHGKGILGEGLLEGGRGAGHDGNRGQSPQLRKAGCRERGPERLQFDQKGGRAFRQLLPGRDTVGETRVKEGGGGSSKGEASGRRILDGDPGRHPESWGDSQDYSEGKKGGESG